MEPNETDEKDEGKDNDQNNHDKGDEEVDACLRITKNRESILTRMIIIGTH